MCKLLIVRRYKKLHVRDCAAQRTSINGKFVGPTLYVHKGDTIIDSLLMFITRAIITNIQSYITIQYSLVTTLCAFLFCMCTDVCAYYVRA